MNLQLAIMAESKMIRDIEINRKRLELFNAFHYNRNHLWKKLFLSLGKRLIHLAKYSQRDLIDYRQNVYSNAKMIVT